MENEKIKDLTNQIISFVMTEGLDIPKERFGSFWKDIYNIITKVIN